MPYGRKKLYTILSLACIAGYIWLIFTIQLELRNSGGVCLIKRVTGVPCPSCGSTRSVLNLLHGDFLKALYINPFGLIIAVIMLVLPIWIVFDIATKKRTLYDFYFRVESFIRKPAIAIPLILLVILNWIWNIKKGL